MVLTLMFAWALVMGVEIRRLALLIGSMAAPAPVGLLLAWHWWRNRAGVTTRSVTFCDAVAGELRSGAPLRMAIAAAAASIEARTLQELCESGAPIHALAAHLGAEFPDVGKELSAVVEKVFLLGAPSADVFDEISGLALTQVEVAQEVAAASAPARATAVVLLVAPVLALAFVGSRSGLDLYLQSPEQRGAVAIGLVMMAAGLSVGGWMLRRAG